MSTKERVSGWVISSLFAAGTLARQARTFHQKRGRTFEARVVRHPELALDLEPLADRLAGDARVRFSGALRKAEPLARDVLGCAIRFRHAKEELLLATMTANVEDYLANDYHAVSPLDVGLVHELHFRLRPDGASLDLDVGASPDGPWSPIVRVELIQPAARLHALRRGIDTMSEWARPRTVP
ncbi:MAG TPA: hypothetical protein VGH87_06745 [Polyangiaceae bacterium]